MEYYSLISFINNNCFNIKKQANLNEVEGKAAYSLFISTSIIIFWHYIVIFWLKFIFNSAINIAIFLNISETIIGISLVAFGTSLPELVVGIMSALKRRIDFALGNVLGSNIYNVLGVLGLILFGDFKILINIINQDLFLCFRNGFNVCLFKLFLKRFGRSYLEQ